MGVILTRDLSDPTRTQATKARIFEGFGSPEGVKVGNMGDIYINRNGGSSTTMYSKETGFNTNTGWVAMGAGGSGGWADEEIFSATEDQTEFVVSGFVFDANSQLEVLQNGLDLDEGEALDWTRNVGESKIILNSGAKLNARIKIKKWK